MQPYDFWQEIFPAGHFPTGGGHDGFYPAALPDGRQILLPIRPLGDGDHALASLIVNQASFAVLDALVETLVEKLRPFQADVIAGLPTLGLTLASAVARRLGHGRYVPLGTSRKFWYDEALSVPLSSITTPGQAKRLYVDPRMLPLLQGRRVVLIDDVISSGRSIRAGLSLLDGIGVRPVATAAAMLQSERWRDDPETPYRGWTDTVLGCFATPILERGADGRWYRPA
uniref:phosphoribosyltransferase n=1 Tax=Paenirhodobacter enshiensis TaxID=1105367 RepID=UPI0035B493D3